MAWNSEKNKGVATLRVSGYLPRLNHGGGAVRESDTLSRQFSEFTFRSYLPDKSESSISRPLNWPFPLDVN